jgi:deoxyribodipyrimidine photolyase-like uncharacterized protein
MAMLLRNWRKMDEDEREAVRHRAQEIRMIMDEGKRR